MTFWQKIKLMMTDKSLRRKILFVVFFLFVYRFVANIPIPAVDPSQLGRALSNDFLGVLNVFSGGGLSSLSIVMLGVGPYITSSIILQVMTLLVPRLKALYTEEGQAGRQKFIQYSRLLTVPLAIVQGYGILTFLGSQGLLTQLSGSEMFVNLSIIVGGSLLAMWFGELITEFGIGNGVSMIIFAGIVAALPSQISQMIATFTQADIPLYVLFLGVSLVVVAGVVFITEAERLVPVTYARQSRGMRQTAGGSTFLPLKLNQAGVIPIIFALSLTTLPQIIGALLSKSESIRTQEIAVALSNFSNHIFIYGAVYFVLVFFFTYFYTAVTFDPKAMSENLQRGGAFIPGIRPGPSTSEYVGNIVSKITMVGALFLGVIAVLPIVMRAATGTQSIAIGGTSLLIAVTVALDLVKKINAQLSMREY